MTYRAVFDRAHDRILARLGEDAVLRGTAPCRVNIEHGVVVQYEIGDAKFYQSEVAATVTVANIPSQYNPKPGDSLTVGVKTYTIDAIASDNGFLARCVLR